MFKFILVIAALGAVPLLSALPQATPSPRETTALVAWKFIEDKNPAGAALEPPSQTVGWQAVTVPHIFRQSGLPDNTAGWYRISFDAAAGHDRRFLLMLEGAATVKDVFVNGRHIGRHVGAFTASAFDLTPAVQFDRPNELVIRVGNRDDEVVGSLARSPLFYVNGGMFRHAWLVKTGMVHIAPDSGSSGVYLTPAAITAGQAELGVRTVVRNPLAIPANVLVRHFVTAPDGAAAAEFQVAQTVPAGATVTVTARGLIPHPQLWDLGRPNLYTVRTELSVNGVPSDAVTERTGFRTIAMKNGKFLLNGREVQFRGVNKHEQSEDAWNAVGDEAPRNDFQMLADLGVNAVRLAHYPHSHLEYDLADRQGIAVWAENGFAGQVWKGAVNGDKAVTADGERLTREMVRQNWNHPAILFWSCGNETIAATASRYAEVIHEEDSTRLVTYAANISEPQNCDFVAWNTYAGWYGGQLSGFKAMPRNALISETGAGDWLTHHVPYGTFRWSVDKFEPEEYAEMFTEYRLQTVCRDDTENRPLFFWWVFREFYDHKFRDNRNTKGLITLAGQPKDIYFLFQAFLHSDRPVVHLNGRTHFLRRFAADNGIKAYANTPTLTLTVNGVTRGTQRNGDYRLPDSESKAKNGAVTTTPGIPVANVFFWKTPLAPGRNVIAISDGHGHDDQMIVYQQSGGTPPPAAPDALVQDLRSSNPANPAVFIDRAIEAQGPVYTDVDGSSDNTFDLLPAVIDGASWIATRRLSDPALKTNLGFRLNPASKGATVFVLFSTGTHPVITLKPQEPAVAAAAEAFARSLTAAGFKPTDSKTIWRDHGLNRTDAALWSRPLAPGEALSLPGETLDYVVLLKPAAHP
ncbi:MAG: DUF2020 domain-containing protein [Verrucomicrobia bacterium]|nr:DUF2020 domain-containing protein [Verrucomicrobiota bacterium]